MIRKLVGTGLALSIGLVISFAIGEIGARLLSSEDADGNVLVWSTRVRPYRPPIQRVRERVGELTTRTDLCLHYDAMLGWAPNPGRVCLDGLYVYDAQGIRADDPSRSLAPSGAPNVRRVVILGDSFTHGDDVPYAQTWAHLLERASADAGSPVEVVNLGVGGYGMDQALLRWRQLGPSLHPTVVIFGFQVENSLRNLNMIRPLYYWGTDLPFAKPRLVIEGGELLPINIPVLPPGELADTLARIEQWPLARYEAYYDAADYRPGLLYWSRFAAFVAARVDRIRERSESGQREQYAPGSEAAELAVRIVEQLRSEAQAVGSEFYVVHLPRRQDIDWIANERGPLVYEALLRRLDRDGELIDPMPAMVEAVASARAIARARGSRALFGEHGHYSERGNRIVAEAVSRALAPR